MSITPALDFINHKTSKETAMDRALAAIAHSAVQHAERVRALRSGHLAGAFGDRRAQVEAIMGGRHYMISSLVNYRFEGLAQIKSDACLDWIRQCIRNLVASRKAEYWRYSATDELAYRNAYCAIRLMRLADRRASLNLIAAE